MLDLQTNALRQLIVLKLRVDTLRSLQSINKFNQHLVELQLACLPNRLSFLLGRK
jgi:hypothetical protein